MNRILKFRGWSEELKIWVYGDLIQDRKSYYISWGDGTLIRNCLKVSEGSVSQFTGIKDVNGNEIYELDYIKGTTHSNRIGNFQEGNKPTNIYHVKFDSFKGFSLGLRLDRLKKGVETVEVIGNSFNNPYL